MKITAYILCFNEEYLIQNTLNHYWKFCNRIVVLDNHSTDDSVMIAKRMGCEVVYFGQEGVLDDREYLQIKNNIWKGDKSDFVIVCDMDELLYDHSLLTKLNYYKTTGITMPMTLGFNCYSEDHVLPECDIIFDFNKGFIDPNFSKRIVFNPQAIQEMNYRFGAHRCSPTGKVTHGTSHLQVRHYRCLGGVQRMIDRHALYAKRMSKFNLQHKLGGHYLRTEEEIRAEWAKNIARCQIIR